MRLAPVMLALLLALSPGAVAMQASAPTPSTATQSATASVGPSLNENTTAVLTLGTEPERTSFDSPSTSLGSSLAADREAFETELSVRSLDAELESADSESQKKQVLTRYRYRIENRVISLESEEKHATDAFSNGSISSSEYVRTLARIDSEAEHVLHTTRAVQRRAAQVPDFGMPNIYASVQVRLLPLEGPIRDRVAKALDGTADPVEVHVSAAETGVVLSMIRDDEYVREVVRPDRRDSSKTESLTPSEALDLVSEQYPWTRNNSAGGSSSRYSSTDVYDVTISHSHGNLTASLDAGTGEIFKEVQYKRLSGQGTLPPGPGVRNTTEGQFGSENVTLTVNRTYAGGPLRAQLTNETGEPLDGEISVDGESVGTTGEDGVVWTLGPDEAFRVTGTYDGTTVEVTTTPVDLDDESSEG
ncbi:hypothetical protein NGM10_09330 [Halorussus salilacus]|uniref:DUF7094 domain-containing protein n=1 Tax=Halorussus salilacus TaxID=2953750 RepID=UPI00209E9BAE|nr:hypothetical protein [Halorussus salilacus]USZ66933.1 hypothetical protein NGM10_09330 [Halorussus salilacus]